MALRDFAPDEMITHCKAALKDLTSDEDEALREEALQSRQFDPRYGHPRPQRDFSIIRSSSRKCSQLLLGPARYINHDCVPNAEFRRQGHQLSIRCIRPIRCDEEITTFYGENYFDLGNRECMCATCERLQRGYFGADAPPPTRADTPHTETEAPAGRVLRSRAARDAVNHAPEAPADMIAPQVDPDALGPLCECLTCDAHFSAPEKWWTPDECPRCERHYKLFKADWPSRRPAENPASVPPVRGQKWRPHSASGRRTSDAAASSTPTERAKRPRGNGADESSPVKLSPLREMHEAEPGSEPAAARRRGGTRRRFEVRSDDSDSSLDEHPVGPRILGHDASTDVLASFWGAPSGARRVRRPTNMAVTVLTERRVASQPLAPRRPPRRTHQRAVSEQHGERHDGGAADAPAPRPGPAIATKGPERTSVSNLALFWSGGVEGRTRAQARLATQRGEPPVEAPSPWPSSRAPLKAESPRAEARVKAEALRESPDVKVEAPHTASAEASALAVRAASPVRSEPLPRIKAESPVSPRVATPPIVDTGVRPPGVPPRQAVRRNLRWGSGKTSYGRVPDAFRPGTLSPRPLAGRSMAGEHAPGEYASSGGAAESVADSAR